MAKKTTSYSIKQLLEQHVEFGGTDWKRGSKKTDPATSAIIREFTNQASGQAVRVIEIPNTAATVFDANGHAFVFVETQPKTALQNRKPLETFMDADPAHNAAADKAIQMLIEGDRDNDEFDDLVRAGGRAWKNKFCFAYTPKDRSSGGEVWWITPIAYFQKNGHCYDGHIPVGISTDLDSDQFQEGQFELGDGTMTPQKIGDRLTKAGFVYDSDFQNFIDPSVNLTAPAAEAPELPPPQR